MAEVRLSEAASILGVSVATVWRRLRKGEIKGRRGPDGHWLVFVPDGDDAPNREETRDGTVDSGATVARTELELAQALLAEVRRQRDDLLRELNAATIERSELRNLLAQAMQRLVAATEPPPAAEVRPPTDMFSFEPIGNALKSAPGTVALGLAVILVVADLLVLRSLEVPAALCYALLPLLAALRGSRTGALLLTFLALVGCTVVGIVHHSPVVQTVANALFLAFVGYLSATLAVPSTQRTVPARAAIDDTGATIVPLARVADVLEMPVGTLLARATLLRDQVNDANDPELVRQAREIEGVAWQLKRFSDALRDAALAAQGELRVKSGWADLAALARDVVDEARGSTPPREISLIAPNPVEGPWDPVHVRQLLETLVTWATTDVEGTGEVQVDVRSSNDHASVSVRRCDRGGWVGSLSDFLAAGRWRERATEQCPVPIVIGFLAAKAAVEAYGGRIWLAPEDPVGTTMHVRLPTYRPTG